MISISRDPSAQYNLVTRAAIFFFTHSDGHYCPPASLFTSRRSLQPFPECYKLHLAGARSSLGGRVNDRERFSLPDVAHPTSLARGGQKRRREHRWDGVYVYS
jgi:hypothetical protein